MNRVSLKNIKFSEWNSEETNCFKGDVYFDNKKVGFCSNEGRGGNTYVWSLSETFDKFKEMEEYCKSLPDIVYKIEGHEEFTIKSDLENVVDRIFEEWLEKKEDKKLEKNFNKGICFGTKNRYQISSFKRGGKSITISELCNNIVGRTMLEKHCESLKKQGHIILNTNLPFEV